MLFRSGEALQTINFTSDEIGNHVLIAGGGRVGMQMARIFHRLNIAFAIIELDQRRVEIAKQTS